MAVSVDTVYQRVLAIANKEQRGYITPQEFNLLANQAQLEIFEQYFYDINQFGRMRGNSTEYSDMLNILNEKISNFKKSGTVATGTALPSDLYRLGTIIYTGGTTDVEVELIDNNDILYINSSALTKPTVGRPVYTRDADKTIKVYPTSITTGVSCNYVAKPTSVAWGYNVILGKPLYNSTTSTNFELHPSEETTVVMKILELAGISMKQPDVAQAASGKVAQESQQEKQ